MPEKKHADSTFIHMNRSVAGNAPKGGMALPAIPVLQRQAPPLPTSGSLQSVVQRTENKTGMPDQLKAGLESLSGIDLSPVRVNFNSSKPAQLNALAFAQGESIHLAPGQEKHLPHEAWHVVQQKQGRVSPTMQVNGQPVNNDRSLEAEADRMGSRAIQLVAAPGMQDATPQGLIPQASIPTRRLVSLPVAAVAPAQAVIQRVAYVDATDSDWYKTMFQLRYAQTDHLSGSHNYGFELDNEANWAKSASNGHAEMKILQYVNTDEPVQIVSELSPCAACQTDLTGFEREHKVEVTVYHFTNYTDSGVNSNKENIQAFYQKQGYIIANTRYVPYLTEAGKKVVGISVEAVADSGGTESKKKEDK